LGPSSDARLRQWPGWWPLTGDFRPFASDFCPAVLAFAPKI
jgi:hypothetical protein